MSSIARPFRGVIVCFVVLIFALAVAWPGAHAASRKSQAWADDFSGASLNRTRWVVLNSVAPGYRYANHIGYLDPSHVRLSDGYLVLVLDQEPGTVDGVPGVVSYGGGIRSKQAFGYGTFEWTMQMSTTAEAPTLDFIGPGESVSGSVSAGFVYANDSETEIDFELSGSSPDTLYMTNWHTVDNSTALSARVFGISGQVHTYKLVWTPASITYYVDNLMVGYSTTNIPTAPGYLIISHWGSNSQNWGGTATIGKRRYFYISRVSYAPAQ